MNKILLLSALIITPTAAMAYIDPGTGSMALQAAIAAIAGTMVGLRAGWDRLKAIVSRKQPQTSIERSDSAQNDPLDRR